MLEDIKKVIEENLPEQMGNVLKARLEQAKERELRLVETEKKCEQLETDLKYNVKLVKKLQEQVALAGDLTRREEEVSTRERNQLVVDLKHSLAVANKVNDRIMDFVNTLVRNPVVRETVTRNWTTVGYDDHQVPVYGSETKETQTT
jgi:hypothetical protein